MSAAPGDHNPSGNPMLLTNIKEELPSYVEDCPEQLSTGQASGGMPVELSDSFVDPEFIPPVTQRPDLIEVATPGPTTKRKRNYSNGVPYDDSSIDKIISQVRLGTMTLNRAAKESGIPRTTLQYRMSNEYKNKGTRGPYKVFNRQEEDEIVHQLLDLEQRGFPLTHRSLLLKVSNYLKANPRGNPFKDGQPGKSWVKLFLQHHPELKLQTHEDVQAADSIMSEKVIRTWFETVSHYFKRQKLTDVLSDPSRVLNGEMAVFMLNSRKAPVFPVNDYSSVESTNGVHNMVMLFSFAADGSHLPPLVVFAKSELGRNTRKYFSDSWKVASSNNGMVDCRCLVAYVRDTLRPALITKGVKLPVLYFISGEAAFEAADFCLQYGVIIISLFPYARDMFQADTTVCKVVKNTWKDFAATWKTNRRKDKRMRVADFGPRIGKAVADSFDEYLIKKGFSTRGLYPFDANTIDYSDSCDSGMYSSQFLAIEHGEEIAGTSTEAEDESQHQQQVQIPPNVLKRALDLLGTSKINLYLTEPADELCQEDKALSYIYKNILAPAESALSEPLNEAVLKPTEFSSSGIFLGDMTFEDVLIKTEPSLNIVDEKDGSEETNEMSLKDKSSPPPKRPKPAPGICQINEADSSNSSTATKIDAHCFAKEHICSYPRVTAHFCKVARKTKYQACFMDVTGMYIAYINKCNETSQEPVSSKVYSSLLQKERASDPKLPTTCDECQHVEKFDADDARCDFINE